MRPLQRRYNIQHSRVARIRIFLAADFPEVQVAKNVEPVIHGHHDHVARTSQVVAVERMRGARASGEAASVEPEHHGPLASYAGREHVEHQAIFAFKGRCAVAQDQRVRRTAKLRRGRAVLEGVAYARPWLRLAGGHETVAARRRCAVGHPSKRVHALLDHAAKFPGSRFHDGRLVFCSRVGTPGDVGNPAAKQSAGQCRSAASQR